MHQGRHCGGALDHQVLNFRAATGSRPPPPGQLWQGPSKAMPGLVVNSTREPSLDWLKGWLPES